VPGVRARGTRQSTMTRLEMAMLAVAIEENIRPQIKVLLEKFSPDDDEQMMIMGALLALMTRKMYRQEGEPWLEAFVKAVMIPPHDVAPPSLN